MSRRPSDGFAAKYDTECSRCSRPILVGDRVVYVRHQLIHVGCHGGGDEE